MQVVQPVASEFEHSRQLEWQAWQKPVESVRNPLGQTHLLSESLTALPLQLRHPFAVPFEQPRQEVWQARQFPV